MEIRLTNKMKRSFFQAVVVSILLYGCTTWTLTKRLEKKLDGNYARMLRAILNKSRWQHPTRHQLYDHLPPITKTIQVRWTRHAGHSWRSKDELISDVLLWTPTYSQAKAGWPARTYIQQLCEDTGCTPEDLPEAMNDREKWRERVRDIRAGGTTWWWWWWCKPTKVGHFGFSSHLLSRKFSKIGITEAVKSDSHSNMMKKIKWLWIEWKSPWIVTFLKLEIPSQSLVEWRLILKDLKPMMNTLMMHLGRSLSYAFGNSSSHCVKSSTYEWIWIAYINFVF